MYSNRLHAAAAVLCLATTVSTGASAAFSEPSFDFGNISSFAVTVDPSHAANLYTKQLTFSLSEDADVRIDMRAALQSYKYVGATFSLSNSTFNLYDANHTLLGTSAIDPTFAQTDGNSGCFFVVCRYNLGVTLQSSLKAGNYAIEFSATSLGFSTPNMYFGVSKNEATTINTYLTQVTPAGAVPEASTYAMMLLGLTALGVAFRKHQA